MRVLRALDVKVLRDFALLRGQLAAIVLVIACGVGVFLGMRGTMRSLTSAKATYYAHERFGHVFARLQRAPELVADRLRAIGGVQSVQTRVVADVKLDVPGLVEAATGRLVSLPDRGRPLVDDVRLRSGRMPEAGRWREVVASEAFAEAHDFALGATIGAVIDGRHQDLTIVGTGLSPEYTYSIGPGLIFPDDRRFGVLWIRRGALGPAFDMEGAFNDVSLRVSRDANQSEVIERVDRVLERYGGLGAIPRADQQSAFFVDNELRQLETFAFLVPALFLAVAAFLLNVVLGRIVARQRPQIAAMKAFGYRDREVGAHFAKLVGAVVGAGCLVGAALGAWIGSWMTRQYAAYYRFPELPFELGLADALAGIAITIVAAAAGTWAAIRRTIVLPPAEAMRPEAPASYRASLLERLGVTRFVPTAVRIVLRELSRRPLRASLSILGIAMAAALTVMNAFTFDSIRHMLNVQFGLNQREDVQLTLAEPRSLGALSAVRQLPGVLYVEPQRSVPVELTAGPRRKVTSITGVPAGARLTALLDVDLADVPVPREGLVLSRKLAELLVVETGDVVRARILEGERAERALPIARIVETYVGASAHMELAALARLLGETETMNAARLVVDEAELARLHAAVKATPVVAGVTARDTVLRRVQTMIDETIGTWVVVSLSFSLVMAFGVLYNAVRITLAERARELASLRVLGYRRREVAAILLGELALLVGLALPLGLVLGHLLCRALVASPGFDNEQFRIPLVVSSATYATAVVTVLAAAGLSAWSAWRALDRIDIVEVLKTSD